MNYIIKACALLLPLNVFAMHNQVTPSTKDNQKYLQKMTIDNPSPYDIKIRYTAADGRKHLRILPSGRFTEITVLKSPNTKIQLTDGISPQYSLFEMVKYLFIEK